MFSITAINDKDSGGKWETLAPSKEAQEFRLSQNYHDGLVNLHAKEYIKARELLEAVLKDPLVSGAVGSNASDSHLLQLRFLALKNLAAVFLQQGANHYDNALQCYLQAVEIDDKDPVVWNQLGTLSCSMGLLSTSRWAFEQGLLCSPNNWNCMEKLLEVLIAIGDEVSCLSIANLILRHWPSHSRALHVKTTIEYAEPIHFAPRGIDKLEPKHARLRFSTKRKRMEDDIEKSCSKRQNQNVEIYLSRVTWEALADAILDVMVSENLRSSGQKIECTASAAENEIETNGQTHIVVGRNGETVDPENDKRNLRYTDIKITIRLSPSVESVRNPAKGKVVSVTSGGECLSLPDYDFEKIGTMKEQENYTEEDHPQGRRSTRLGRLRSRKPEKEDLDSFSGKDLEKAVLRFLEPFILKKLKPIDQNFSGSYGSSSDVSAYTPKDEYNDVKSFVTLNSQNCGAYHIGHLLLEEVAYKRIPYQNNFDKLLQLEKLTRLCGQDRTPLCTLFLAELYYDHGLHTDDDSKRSEFFTEASYHLCKVIELVSLDCSPVSASFLTEMKGSDNGNTNLQCNSDSIDCGEGDENGEAMVEESVHTQSKVQSTLSTDGSIFWVRFFWLSGCLSISSGGKRKAIKELSICLSILRNRKNSNDSDGIIPLPHCRVARSLTVDRIHHQLSLLRIDSLLKKAIKMGKKGRHKSCIDLLSPLFLSAKDVYPDFVCGFIREGFRSVELQALDVLISSCEKEEPMDIEVYLSSHKRKLQILTCAAGMINPLGPGKNNASSELKMNATPDPNRIGNSQKHWNHLIYEEIKAISQTVSRVKSIIERGDPFGDSHAVFCTVGEIQTLLIWVMCDAVRAISSQKVCGVGAVSQSDQLKSGSLVDAAITFCKLQHLDPTVPIKAQVELIVSVHDLLAEYGLCCAGKDSEGEEGTFLKLAIKHLLALDVKLKSNYHSSYKKAEMKQADESFSLDDPGRSAALKPKELSSSDACAAGEDECAQLPKECTAEMASEISACARLVSIEEGTENRRDGTDVKSHSSGENSRDCNLVDSEDLLEDLEREKVELGIDNALDQSFFCLYGLNLKTGQDSSSEDDLATHKNTNRGDFQTKEQCADVFQYILPYARVSSRAGIVKLRRVLRAIRKHFPQPPDDILARNAFNKFLEDPELSEDDLCEVAWSGRGQEAIISKLYPDVGSSGPGIMSSGSGSSESYAEVYSNLYYFIAQAEEMSATDKVPGFVLKKEGEEFVEQSANLFKYDLMYNPLRFESWQKLANIYDEEVDLLLNDGSKHINAVDWKRSHNLPQRVEMGRRRSRRCLLMSLALAGTPDERSQVHELLGLVYYDSLQNVVPFYDQRSVVPTKDTTWRSFCENSMKHFEKAFSLKPDWLHAFYLGKICEKMGYSSEKALSYYSKAISLNPSAVDPLYRLHASRIKLLCGHGNRNLVVLHTVASYPFKESTTKAVSDMLGWASDCHRLPSDPKVGMCDDSSKMSKPIEPQQLDEAWHLLYDDCLSGLEVCVEGELKHFHRARYRLAQGLYKRGESGDIERAKDELGFCFRSSRSSFTINMWEIDSMVKKGRRKTPGPSGNRRCFEVTLPESSRKFITCIRKYVLFYTFLLEESKDLSTLERAYSYIRTDKRFSLCLVDIVPVVLGRYVKVLSSLIRDAESGPLADPSLTLEILLERMFNVLLDHVNQLGDLGSLPEVECPELSESSLYGYIHQYIHHLEMQARIDSLEGMNERIRRRFKTPKLSNSNLSRICKHASIAWCRSILFKLASITQVPGGAAQPAASAAAGASESGLQLFVDLQPEEICRSSVEGSFYSKELEERCQEALSGIRDAHVRQASDEHLEAAAALLRCAYSFFRDSSCGTFPSGIRLYTVSSLPAPEGAGALDLSVPRKLLLWAYALMHGHYSSISAVMKFFEDNIKSRVRKGVAAPSALPHAAAPPTPSVQAGGPKEKNETGEPPAVEETPPSEAQMPPFLGRQLLHQCSSSKAAESSGVGSREDPGD